MTDEPKKPKPASPDDMRQGQVHRAAIPQSKRPGVRRTVVAVVAAAAIAGGGIATAEQFTGDGDGGIQGTFYNTTVTEGGGETLQTWQPGDEPTDITPDPAGMYNTTGSVSPDGRYVAYLTEEDDGEQAHKIRIHDLKSDKTRTVGEYSSLEELCTAPAWSPDGERLFVDQGADAGNEGAGFVDAESGEFTPVDVPHSCDVKVASDENGDDVLFSTDTEADRVDVYVTDADGKTTKTTVDDIVRDTGRFLIELVAVSPDGRFACASTDTVHEDGSGEFRSNSCDMLIDVVAGEPVELPVGQNDTDWCGGQYTFTIEDRLLILVPDDSGYDWQLFGYDGKPIGEPVETDLVISNVPAFIGFVPEIG